MYLMRMFLNARCKAVRSNRNSPEELHRTVMRLFPSDVGPQPRKQLGVLHRLDEGLGGRLMLLLQSGVRPDVHRLPEGYLLDVVQDADLTLSGITDNPVIREVDDERSRIAVGEKFRFRLKANTTKRVGGKSSQEIAGFGKRVPLRGDAARINWLERRAETGGFHLIHAEVREVAAQGERVRLAGGLFEGLLEVRDPDAFRGALADGIGPAKAFGFGLLSVARVA